MEEKWRPVSGYGDMYIVSNIGNLSRIKRHHRQSKNTYTHPPRHIQPCLHLGYPQVAIGPQGHRKTITVHRLVAIAFIPNPKNLPLVNHIDGNRRNNRIDNLEWVTHSEYLRHAIRIGLDDRPIGENSRAAKLTNNDVLAIRSDSRKQKDIAKHYGISRSHVNLIQRRKIWTHID